MHILKNMLSSSSSSSIMVICDMDNTTRMRDIFFLEQSIRNLLIPESVSYELKFNRFALSKILQKHSF